MKAAEVALASGERGALERMLRAEGIYSSQLAAWRLQFGARGESGLVSRTPGRKPKLNAKDRELLAVTKKNEVLQRKLRIANALIELQKNYGCGSSSSLLVGRDFDHLHELQVRPDACCGQRVGDLAVSVA